MLGSPGTGKTLLAQRLWTILPELGPVESLQTTQGYSAVGLLSNGQSRLLQRPFRAPRHTVRVFAWIEGGFGRTHNHPRPYPQESRDVSMGEKLRTKEKETKGPWRESPTTS
jgi:predicted ATPase with chaperone activity